VEAEAELDPELTVDPVEPTKQVVPEIA
jgi:hypothetical protein